MIVGSGSIAKLLHDRDGFIFFAAGVSHSRRAVHGTDVLRESMLLGQWITDAIKTNRMFVYFSTISIFYKRSDYTDHKASMENIIRQMCPNYMIIRLGNIWECTNPNTFRNYIRASRERGNNPRILKGHAYMISKDDLAFVTNNLPATGQNELCVFGEMLTIEECLNRK